MFLGRCKYGLVLFLGRCCDGMVFIPWEAYSLILLTGHIQEVAWFYCDKDCPVWISWETLVWFGYPGRGDMLVTYLGRRNQTLSKFSWFNLTWIMFETENSEPTWVQGLQFGLSSQFLEQSLLPFSPPLTPPMASVSQFKTAATILMTVITTSNLRKTPPILLSAVSLAKIDCKGSGCSSWPWPCPHKSWRFPSGAYLLFCLLSPWVVISQSWG